jgi:hypothetical protein
MSGPFVVGNGVPGIGGPATSAQIGCPEGLALGKDGSLLLVARRLFSKSRPVSDRLVREDAMKPFRSLRAAGRSVPVLGKLHQQRK